ncbi:MAG: PAS domain-containing sensor histidine kinase, partial [Rhodobacteraceae bacterium]|nr:PAS domain-containing sensor histidine kinase [Paracoccaceae bacterium]
KFARMPQPETREEDIVQLVRDAVVLQRAGQPDVAFDLQVPETGLGVSLDRTMIMQALTNLMKNAGEAIETRVAKGVPEDFQPEIHVAITLLDAHVRITIADNGIGLPEDRARLFEPYVTTRDAGTGLGLPIVKKIIEEHGGTLVLEDAPAFGEDAHRGAMAVITLDVAVQPVGETE